MQELKAVKAAIDSKDMNGFVKALRNVHDRKSLVPIFSSILLDEWHEAHEDIVFELGIIGNPSATNAIAKAATVPFQYLIDWDNLHEFQRKCAYALARIDTNESRMALINLSENPDPFLSEYGKEGLEHWPLKK